MVQIFRNSLQRLTLVPLIVVSLFFAAPAIAYAGTTCGSTGGPSGHGVVTSIDLGCKGKGNPIMDLTFGIIRFLSMGVGLVLIGSMVWAGIQYAGSRGDPQATASAVRRIQSNVIALLIFIFAYAILNYLVPGTFLR